ncbi:radial spoke head 1 homolog [Oscarella lobularis]|uniref:radial spoke head 1 homolog n=1 Tax=Oscarella lobularis TaxID=121494 RepID=UPI003313623B
MSDDGSENEFEDQGPNLGTYEGDRNEKDERHGFGKAVLPNGDAYEGEYQNGKRHGKGSYRFKNNARYVGEYVQGKKHGNGTMIYPDGSKYEGNWVEDQKYGHGTYTYVNGDTYEGEWQDNMRHGQGCYTYNDTKSKYVGTWVNGQREGAGQLMHSNHKFAGNFKTDMPSGEGRYVFDIGCEQHGHYIIKEVSQGEDEDDEEAVPILEAEWRSGEVIPIEADRDEVTAKEQVQE